MIREKRFPEAIATLNEILSLAPDNAAVHNTLGSILAMSGEPRRASRSFEIACRLSPGHHDYWYNFGKSLETIPDIPGACTAFSQAIKLKDDDVNAYISRSNCLAALGESDMAVADLRWAIQLKPDSLRAWTGLMNTKSSGISDEELDVLSSLHESAPIGSEQRMGFGFIYGQALESHHEYDDAFRVFVQSNALKKDRIKWQPSVITDYVVAAMSAFTAGNARAGDDGLGKEMVFLVGMPRSGSTLLEQILCSHPDVAGGGELMDAHAVLSGESDRRGHDLLAWAPTATPADWERLGHDYLDRTSHLRRDKPILVDKQLDNWRYTGALHAMLPAARFIFCRRDPVETCWSCFKHSFIGNSAGFSYDQQHLAQYWHDLQRLVQYWQRLYPGLVFEHSYENLITETEASVRRTLEYCNLEFHESCLRFYQTHRVVQTASATQVRRPIDANTAISDRYGTLLEPLRRALLDANEPLARLH